MGATASVQPQQSKDASIELEKANMYLPGQIVSGKLNLNSKNYHNKSVSIDLIGEVGYSITSSSGSGAMVTAYHHVPFFSVSQSSIMDGEKFALTLDENLPPTLNLSIGIYPYVRYFLQVNLNKSNKHRHYIIVCPIVSIPRTTLQTVNFAAINRKEVQVSGSIDRNWVLPGEMLQINFEVKNPQHHHIKYIDGHMFMRAKFSSGDYNEKIMDFAVDNVRDSTDEHISGIIPLIIPSQYLPPTFIHTDDTHQFSVNIDYLLDVEVHTRGVFTTLKGTMPLSVGFEPEKIISDGTSNAQHRHLAILRDDVKRTSLIPHHHEEKRYSHS